MNYPLISDYIEAIHSAEDNFDQLQNLRPVLDNDGNPVMSSGNFAVVFKMKDVNTGRFYAVKCFIKEQEGRAERYRQISDELQYIQSPYLLHVRYMDKEIFVSNAGSDGEEYPVLMMDWVEGLTLDAYIRQHINDSYALRMLAYRFCKMGAWLMSQSFAHGDLKPDNILARDDGSLVLVDYDGMYVPAMEGEKAYEMGSPDFRHPLRTEQDFNEHIDDFSISSIALSLKAIAINPEIYVKYSAADRLLLSAADYRDLSNSAALQAIMLYASDAELSTLLAAFLLASSRQNLAMVSFRIFILNEPEKPKIEPISTEITKEDLAEAIEDEYGVKYSKDGKKLLTFNLTLNNVMLKTYSIKNGTKAICNGAFRDCSSLLSISIPDSVINIGARACDGCRSMRSIDIPDSVKSIGVGAFSGCCFLRSIDIPDNVKSIGDGAFSGCSSLQSIHIPKSVKSIGDGAFRDCSSLQSIHIPKSVNSIGDRAFSLCSSLQSIDIPASVKSIGDSAFSWCYSLRSINIPDSVNSIGEDAFRGCSSLLSINIPDGVNSIGKGAFEGCSSLQSIVIPDSVNSIGILAFSGCSSLQSIVIPKSVNSIGGGALNGCVRLTKIVIQGDEFYVKDNFLISSDDEIIACWSSSDRILIPASVKSIGDSAFSWCSSLQSIDIPDSVKNIGNEAFHGCSSLQSIVIPDSVKSIGNGAFSGCRSLWSIDIPDSVKSIGNGAFSGCRSLWSIDIPDSVKSIGAEAFRGCSSMQSIVIPDSVNSIGGGALNECVRLTKIVIQGDEFYVKDDFLISRDDEIIACWSSSHRVLIPDSVNSIGAYAFRNCWSLRSIDIPDSISSIRNSAFIERSSLQSIVIPESVKSIGVGAFSGCRFLRSIVIPDSVNSIGNSAFNGCKSLHSIVIPDSVNSIGDEAFCRCSSLRVINIPDSVNSIGEDAFYSCSSLESIYITKGTREKFMKLLPGYLQDKLVEK